MTRTLPLSSEEKAQVVDGCYELLERAEQLLDPDDMIRVAEAYYGEPSPQRLVGQTEEQVDLEDYITAKRRRHDN